jgi:hypothetical protein
MPLQAVTASNVTKYICKTHFLFFFVFYLGLSLVWLPTHHHQQQQQQQQPHVLVAELTRARVALAAAFPRHQSRIITPPEKL